MSKLLLLSCCAPCSCAVIEKLAAEKRDFTVLYYNPNVQPADEYVKRRDEQKKLCERYGVRFVDLEYDPENWNKAVKGLENEPERGKRCSACFALRLKKAALYAVEHGFDAFSSVLAASRWKDLDQVNAAAASVERETGVAYDYTNWRKNGLEPRRAVLVKETGMYSQNYCGCPYSKRV